MQPTSQLSPIEEPASIGWALNFCLASYVDDPDKLYKGGGHRETNQPERQLNIEHAVSKIKDAQGYQVVWSSDQTPLDNYAYIVRSPDNAHYLTIRGSVLPNLPVFKDANGTVLQVFYNWVVEDLNVFSQVPWKFAAPPADAWISQGSYIAFKNILGAYNVLPGSKRETAWEYLRDNALSAGYPVYVSGHSLGGNIAYTYGSYLAQQAHESNLSKAALYLYTFAGPAPGNEAFVADLADKYSAERAVHFELEYDLVPKFPNKEALTNLVANFYPGKGNPQAATIELMYGMFTWQEVIQTVAAGIYGAVTSAGPNRAYEQSQSIILSMGVKGGYGDTLLDWGMEAYHQHSLNTYNKGIATRGIPPVAPETFAALLPYITKARASVLPDPTEPVTTVAPAS